MRARTANRLLAWIIGGMVVIIALMSLGGDGEARRLLPPLLAVAGFVAALGYLSRRFKVEPRRAAFNEEAARLGLRSDPGDPTRFLDRGFEVVRRAASVRDVENTATGTWRGREVVVADYWFARSSDPSRNDYVRLVCAVVPVPQAWPRLLVVAETLASLVSDAVLQVDPDTEWERFNRRFAIRTDDRRFASAVLDARMLEWLASLPVEVGFEIIDGCMVCLVPRTDAGDIVRALTTADAFLEHVPRAARSLFGEAAG